MDKARERYSGNRTAALRLYLEVADKPTIGKQLFPEGVNGTQFMVFVKFYDPLTQSIEGLGKFYVQRNSKVADIIPIVIERKGLPPNTSLKLYEEIKPSMIEPMKPRSTFAQSEIQDGDIICAQKDFDKESAELRSQGRFPTIPEYFDYLVNRVTIQFKPKNDPQAPGFELTLTKKTPYDQVAAKVAAHLDADPMKIRFTSANTQNQPKPGTFKRNPNATLNEMISPPTSTVSSTLLFYELLDISIVELETKKLLKVAWLGSTTLKEESTHDLLLPKASHVSEAIDALRAKLSLEGGSKQIRMYEVQQCKIMRELAASDLIAHVGDGGVMVYAEEVPLEEVLRSDDDKYIHVYHFSKETSRAHGIPFKFLIKKDEIFADTKKRLQARTGINDKDWAKVKFAFVPSSAYHKPTALEEESLVLGKEKWGSEDYLGLDHLDKSGRGGRLGGLERAIFIRG
jgi:ubiquitin carboxyl-terminal hydrolase 7